MTPDIAKEVRTRWKVETRRGRETFILSWRLPEEKLTVTMGAYNIGDFTVTEATELWLALGKIIAGIGAEGAPIPGDGTRTVIARAGAKDVVVAGRPSVSILDERGIESVLWPDEAADLHRALGDVIREISWGDSQ